MIRIELGIGAMFSEAALEAACMELAKRGDMPQAIYLRQEDFEHAVEMVKESSVELIVSELKHEWELHGDLFIVESGLFKIV